MKNNFPLVSVIVTTFNRKEMLKDTILSILNQSYSNLELIVVDNYSDYDFLNYIVSFNDSRIRPFLNKNNGIIAVNRNFGINQSKGDFIAFCDDDDLWHPNNIKVKIDYFTKYKSIGMITSKEEIINEIGEKTGETTHSWVKNSHHVTFENLFFKNVGSPSAAMIRRSCFKIVGYFDEDYHKRNIEDIDYWFKISLKFRILYLNKILGSYRVHSKNESYINDRQLLNSYFLRKSFIDKKNKEISSFYYRAKFHLLKLKIKIALFYFRQKRFYKSFEWFFKDIERFTK